MTLKWQSKILSKYFRQKSWQGIVPKEVSLWPHKAKAIVFKSLIFPSRINNQMRHNVQRTKTRTTGYHKDTISSKVNTQGWYLHMNSSKTFSKWIIVGAINWSAQAVHIVPSLWYPSLHNVFKEAHNQYTTYKTAAWMMRQAVLPFRLQALPLSHKVEV